MIRFTHNFPFFIPIHLIHPLFTMKLIVITQPFFFDQEATAIQNLLDWGIDLIHIRKPESAIRDCATLLTSIPATYHNRIVRCV